MRGECDADTHHLSLLEGANYSEELAKNPGYEAKIHALMGAFEDGWGEDAAQVEQELNALIGRDVCTHRKAY